VGAVCQIEATSEAHLTCPSGMPCRVLCNRGDRACRDGVDCGGATRCEVVCGGDRACQGGVKCGASPCDVTCNGTEACESGIAASGVCACHCCGEMSCAYDVGSCAFDSVCM
jgi:hypothetical protein